MSEEATEGGRDYESEARKDGWTPIDEWNGPEEKWKTAEQFVKDGEQITSILKSKIERLESRVEQALETNKKFAEFTKQAQEKESAKREQLLTELKQLRKQAVTEGDGAAFEDAERRIEELQEPPKKQESNGSDEQLTPVAQQWLQDNSWYNTDEKLQVYADGISDRLVQQGFIPQSKAYFDELTQRVKMAFPDDFGNKNRKKPNSVDDGSPSGGSKGRTFDALPEDAKREFARFKRDIPGFTKEQYVSQYDWD